MEYRLSSRLLNVSSYLIVHEATKPSRVYTLAFTSSDFQTMPVRHVQSQQISSLHYSVLSQLSASGCPGMFHQHALFHLPSFWELLACNGFGRAVAVMPDL